MCSPGDRLWEVLLADRRGQGPRGERIRQRLQPLLFFKPLPGVGRAIFIAASHRGTSVAEGKLGCLVGRRVRLPSSLLQRFGDVTQKLDDGDPSGRKFVVPNGIDELRDTDPSARAAADLPISPAVRCNAIVGKDDDLPLVESGDGGVPHRSAHLDGAESEKLIVSWHSVQETPAAILEIRRILHEQMRAQSQPVPAPGSPPAAGQLSVEGSGPSR